MRILGKLLYTSTCLLLAAHPSQVLTTACINNLSTMSSAISTSTTSSSSSSSTTTASESTIPQEKKKKDNLKYESGKSSVAYVTTPNEKVAKQIAHGLVEQRLAACVNILPKIQSVYMWEGSIHDESEYLLMIKTQTSCIEELIKWVQSNHPYTVAEVITLPIEHGNEPYMKWLADSVGEKKK